MFYAYILNNGGKGIVNTWDKCEAIVKGQSSAKYKKFKTIEEATEFITNNGIVEKPISNLDKNAIYFDAGTGRGRGVEVRITRSNGTSLLSYIKSKKTFMEMLNRNGFFINEFDNIELGHNYTNNFGELFGCYIALIIANEVKCKTIYGDSDLVIKYWSKGNCKSDDDLTKKLSNTVTKIRNNFNGSINHISGDINPADLGFHK